MQRIVRSKIEKNLRDTWLAGCRDYAALLKELHRRYVELKQGITPIGTEEDRRREFVELMDLDEELANLLIGATRASLLSAIPGLADATEKTAAGKPLGKSPTEHPCKQNLVALLVGNHQVKVRNNGDGTVTVVQGPHGGILPALYPEAFAPMASAVRALAGNGTPTVGCRNEADLRAKACTVLRKAIETEYRNAMVEAPAAASTNMTNGNQPGESWVTASIAARQANVTEQTIRRWAGNKHIQSKPRQVKGRKSQSLYLISDVLKMGTAGPKL